MLPALKWKVDGSDSTRCRHFWAARGGRESATKKLKKVNIAIKRQEEIARVQRAILVMSDESTLNLDRGRRFFYRDIPCIDVITREWRVS